MAKTRKQLKVRLVANAASSSYQYATVSAVLDGSQASYNVAPQELGTAVFIKVPAPARSPFENYYSLLAYISSGAGNVTVQIPENNEGVVVVLLPNGMFTPRDEIAAAIATGTQPDGSTGVGPTSK